MTRFNEASAAGIAERLRLTLHGHEWRGNCPAPTCGYSGTFSLTSKQGRPVWRCHSCQDQKATTAAVIAAMGTDWHPPRSAKRRKAEGTDTRNARAVAIFDRAQQFPGSRAGSHLTTNRCLPNVSSPALRYHPAVRHPNAAGTFPAMLALVTSTATGEPTGLHKTFIKPDGTGKADLDPNKASKGTIRGGAIMLDAPIPGRPLVIGEGIETSLSAGLLLGVPAWSAVAAGNMANIIPPRDVSEVLIAADHDEPGQREASVAAMRMKARGARVRIVTPPTPGQDFNDLLRAILAERGQP